jgi:hypothetical protein
MGKRPTVSWPGHRRRGRADAVRGAWRAGPHLLSSGLAAAGSGGRPGPHGTAGSAGMAYAELAGLPAITGLYTSILCLVGYAVFGPSRVLVLGPDSSLGAGRATVRHDRGAEEDHPDRAQPARAHPASSTSPSQGLTPAGKHHLRAVPWAGSRSGADPVARDPAIAPSPGAPNSPAPIGRRGRPSEGHRSG